jgi:nitroreductase
MSDDPGLFDIMYSCRAMRRLSSEPVPQEKLDRLIEAAEQAASGGNQQRRRWLIVRDTEQKARLAALNMKVSQALVTERLEKGEALPHHDSARRGRMLKSVLWLAENMQNIHAFVVACHEFDAAPTPAERAAAQSSVYPAIQNLLLAARGMELGAVLTTYALREYDDFVDVLGIPENVAAYALIPVGYPLGKFGPVTRLPVSSVLHYDRWNADE